MGLIILAIVQGLTEFIPVSSSGHLILFRDIFNIHSNLANDLAFDALLQLATIFAVLVYFRKDLWNLLFDFKNLKIIILSTIPAVIAGLFLESYMETIFRNIGLISVTLILGGFIMLYAEKIAKKTEELNLKKGLIIGLFQCLALIPGMSRSGMTISGGLFTGLNREAATRFSFLLSFPIILGSGLKKVFDLYQENLLSTLGTDLLIASIVAFIVGLASIHFLIKFLKNNSLKVFVYYRFGLAILILLILAFRI